MRPSRSILFALLFATSAPASAQGVPVYHPIVPTQANRTIILTGRDLTVEQVIAIARGGAKVELSADARKRAARAYGLLLQGAAEGVPIYWFNRGAGSGRETVIFEGDPTTVENTSKLLARQLAIFKRGARGGYGPELSNEEEVRAILAVRANTLSYEAASPQLVQGLVDLLNHWVTPVVQSRGTVGEGDLATLANIGATLVGEGDAYFEGQRLPAAEALARAGLKSIQPFAADDAALTSTNAYAIAQTVLLVDEARHLLDWADLIHAIELNGMNSSVTPLSQPVQIARPFPWLGWDAARVLGFLKGSYLFEADPKRIIQDPISLRAATLRQGAAWQAWGQLRDNLAISLNSSDHNPAVRPGVGPNYSWELSTPHFQRYRVKGGPLSKGEGGYILSNASWDPYPLVNDVEAFTNALSNAAISIVARTERFGNPFFTVIRPADLPAEQVAAVPSPGWGHVVVDLWHELTGLANPVTPTGAPLINTVEDLQSEARLKVTKARKAVDLGLQLLGQDIATAAYWQDLRLIQDPSRQFGDAPTRVVAAYRKLQSESTLGLRDSGYRFISGTSASEFFTPDGYAPTRPSVVERKK